MFERQKDLQFKNLNEKKRLAAGLVSHCFPVVSHIAIQMQYVREISNQTFLKRTVNFFPTSHAYFDMRCLTKHSCDRGFKLTSMVYDMVNCHKKSENGNMVCHCKNGPYAPNCISLAYDISINYNKL